MIVEADYLKKNKVENLIDWIQEGRIQILLEESLILIWTGEIKSCHSVPRKQLTDWKLLKKILKSRD